MARENKRTRDERRFGKPNSLADYWLSVRAEDVVVSPYARAHGAVECVTELQKMLASIPHIRADNVMEFFANHPQEFWEYSKDFPCSSPPFNAFLIDMYGPRMMRGGDRWIPTTRDGQSPPERIGAIFEAIDPVTVNHIFPRIAQGSQSVCPTHLPEAKWFVRMIPLYVLNGKPLYLSVIKFFALDDRGVFLEDPAMITSEQFPNATYMDGVSNEVSQILMPALLAISFMHCKNVVIENVDPDPVINRERRRAGLKPFLRYHTINIEPMKRVLKTEGNIETEGLKRALHICRGHFSTYSEERPLFGRVAGTFWIPSHVRGSHKQGVVISDYNVKSSASKDNQ